MTDVFTVGKRSEVMSRIRGRDTKPELAVRRLIHAMGYRFRLHRRNLPGTPDIVLPRHGKIILVHGCFWHGHRGCKDGRHPTSNTAYWDAKLARNQQRDKSSLRSLRRLGWKVLTIWECEVTRLDRLQERLATFLNDR